MKKNETFNYQEIFNKINPADFWDREETRRKEMGLSQLDLCRRVDITIDAFKTSKTRVRFPTMENICKIAIVLNCTVDWLLYGNTQISDVNAQKLVSAYNNASLHDRNTINYFLGLETN